YASPVRIDGYNRSPVQPLRSLHSRDDACKTRGQDGFATILSRRALSSPCNMPVYPYALRVADNPSENASRPHDAVLAAEIKLLPLLTYKSRISKRWIKPVSHLEDVNHESIGNGFLMEITQQIHS